MLFLKSQSIIRSQATKHHHSCVSVICQKLNVYCLPSVRTCAFCSWPLVEAYCLGCWFSVTRLFSKQSETHSQLFSLSAWSLLLKIMDTGKKPIVFARRLLFRLLILSQKLIYCLGDWQSVCSFFWWAVDQSIDRCFQMLPSLKKITNRMLTVFYRLLQFFLSKSRLHFVSKCILKFIVQSVKSPNARVWIPLRSLLSGLLTMLSEMFWSIKKRRERGNPNSIPATIT